MRAIMVMYDSLNRRTLPNYGCGEVDLPNFDRLGRESVTFDTCYVGSLPCMPARRDLHTGRLNFLHRGWSPIEPFDDSIFEILSENGVYTHLVSDHDHYWEDGGATYHTRYTSWELERGQEMDPWKGDLGDYEDGHSFGASPASDTRLRKARRFNAVNRQYVARRGGIYPQELVFDKGLEFIENNKDHDNWLLQIESFDPHEPFDSPDEFQKPYGISSETHPYDWPSYAMVREDEAFVGDIRKKYLALLGMCDRALGRVLDMMDKYDMWQDTMLIVNTDHGFLLGEHDWWAKNIMPMYNEIANTPLFVWDPRYGVKDVHRKSLVQCIDLSATILGFFGMPVPADMMGRDLSPVITGDEKIRDYAIYGMFGGHVNITDGEYVYMRAPVSEENEPLYEYTLMPTDMNTRKPLSQMQAASLAPPFSFTKGMPTLKLPARPGFSAHRFGSMLFNVEKDPQQLTPIEDEAKTRELCRALAREMAACDAPAEQYLRLGVEEP